MIQAATRNTLAVLLCVTAHAQSAAGPQSFDVADVRMSKSDVFDPFLDLMPGGRVELHGVTMQNMIREAYRVRTDAIAGAPGWFESDHFEVVAKAPEHPVRHPADDAAKSARGEV